MGGLASILGAAMLAWLGLLAALIALRIMSGHLPLRGMLHPEPGRRVAPERVIAAAVFPFVLGAFVYEALTMDVAAHPELPNISEDLLGLLTGSNVLYLSGKIARKP